MDGIVELTDITCPTGVPQEKEDLFTDVVQNSTMEKVSRSQTSVGQAVA
jgi:hypothetical protein